MSEQLGKKLRRTLELVESETDNVSGMYPGTPLRIASKKLRQLERLGYVEPYIPHNPAHHERMVVTDLGRAALEGQP